MASQARAPGVMSDDASTSDAVIREGHAEVLSNKRPVRKDGKDAKDEVFFNKAQVFNRDLSVLVLSVFARILEADREEKRKKREQKARDTGQPARPTPAPGLKVLEALAATGIRSIRYAKELGEGAGGVRLIVANDLDETATEHIRRNIAHNSIPPGRIEITCADACRHMYTNRARGVGGLGEEAYDVIDLDPYGTCAPFLDAAVQSVADGGLLCITSTDMPILGGNNPETCFARYGGTALKQSFVHEMSLRLVLHAVSTSAARYGREAHPLVSCSIDFYVRMFVRIFDSPVRAKLQASKTGIVHQCVQCEAHFVQPMGEAPTDNPKETKYKTARVITPGAECPECDGRMKLGGPFHIGPLHDKAFVERCLDACEESAMANLPGITSWKKIKGLLTAISEECHEIPLHYSLPQLCKCLKLPPLPLKQFKGTLASLGFKVSHFHREPEAVKTDAPNAIVFDLMRLWAEENPPRVCPLPSVLKKEFTLKRPIEWKTEEEEPRAKVPRFLPNPEANWGPKPRAKGHSDGPAAPQSTTPVPMESKAPAPAHASVETTSTEGPAPASAA